MGRLMDAYRALDRGAERALSSKLVCFVGGPVLMWSILQAMAAGVGLNPAPDERSWQRYEKTQVAARQLGIYAKQMEQVPANRAFEVQPVLNAVAGYSRADCLRAYEAIAPVRVGGQDYTVDVPKYISCVKSSGQSLALTPTPSQRFKLVSYFLNYAGVIGGLLFGLAMYKSARREQAASSAKPS